jgi:hypothetical protein
VIDDRVQTVDEVARMALIGVAEERAAIGVVGRAVG